MTSYIFNDVSTNWIITAKTIQPKVGDTLTVKATTFTSENMNIGTGTDPAIITNTQIQKTPSNPVNSSSYKILAENTGGLSGTAYTEVRSGNAVIRPRIEQVAYKAGDFTQHSYSRVEDDNFDIATTAVDDVLSIFAGVKSFRDTLFYGGFPVSMLSYFETNYAGYNSHTGIRVCTNIIEMFTGATRTTAANIATFASNSISLNQTATGITPLDSVKNTIIPTTAWVYRQLPFNNPNNSRFLGTGGIIASNVDATGCGNALAVTLQFIYYYAIYLTAGTVLTRAGACVTSGGTGANTFRLGLFSGSGFILAGTNNISGTGTTFGGFTSTYTVPLTGFYYLAIQSNGTASPLFSATTATSSTAQAINYPNVSSQPFTGNLAYYRAATTSAAVTGGGAILPSPTSNFTLNALGPQIWVAVA